MTVVVLDELPVDNPGRDDGLVDDLVGGFGAEHAVIVPDDVRDIFVKKIAHDDFSLRYVLNRVVGGRIEALNDDGKIPSFPLSGKKKALLLLQ